MRWTKPKNVLCGTLVAFTLATGCSDSEGGTTDTTTSDADTSQPSDTVTDVAREVIDQGPGLGIDYTTTAAGATPRYEPDSTDWSAIGWPTDRLRVGGLVDLSSFPSGGLELVDAYLAEGNATLDGFGPNGAVYVQFDATLDPSTLPSLDESRSATATIQLVNVTQGSSRYDERSPLLSRWYESGPDKFYGARTLAFRPVFGVPMAHGETHCAIITRAVKDAEGNYLQHAPGFPEAIDSAPWLAPLAAWLPDSPLRREDIAMATCFTTSNPTAGMHAIRDWVERQTPPIIDAVYEPVVTGQFHGTYHSWNFRAGDKPYADEGGEIRYDDSGDPIVQFSEEIRYLLLVPTDRPMPEGGWPVVHYMHGTGGDYESCRSVDGDILSRGMALLCIDQPLHGSRMPDEGISSLLLDFYSFNFLNPGAGRNGFIQGAADTLVLTAMIAAGRFDIDGAVTLSGDDVRLNPEKIYFFGHSHGGLTGALAVAVDPRIKAALLSGASGILVETIIRRKDPVDFGALVKTFAQIAPDDFDTFHPLLTLVQTLVDLTDPLNYAPLWLSPRAGSTPRHVFVTQGTDDDASPSVGNDAMAAHGKIPLIGDLSKVSLAHQLQGIGVEQLPVSANALGADGQMWTAGVKQWQGGSHFVAFRDGEARALWRHFFESAVEGPAVIGAGDAVLATPADTTPGDSCADARAIDPASLPVTILANTSLATTQLDSQGCPEGGTSAAGRDQAFAFTPEADGTYRFRIRLPRRIDFWTPRLGPNLIWVTSDCGAPASCIALDNDLVDVDLVAGTTYYVAVDGASYADKGPYTLSVERRCEVLDCGERVCGSWGCGTCGSCAEGERCGDDGQCHAIGVGDTCQDPIDIDQLPWVDIGDSRDFASDYGYDLLACGEFWFAYGAASSDVVYRLEAPTGGRYEATLAASFDSNLYVVSDCDDIDGHCLAAQRNVSGDERVIFDLSGGETAYIVVDGASNSANRGGLYTLRVDACTPDCEGRSCGDDGCGGSCGSCGAGTHCVVESGCDPIPEVCPETASCVETTPGDRCETPLTIDALPFEDSQTTADFTPAYGYAEGACPGVGPGWGRGAADVVYDFTAPNAGLYHFSLNTDEDFDSNLYLVADCDDISGSCIAGDERERNERIWREFDEGEQAFLIVDGWTNFSNNTGSYTLKVRECVPSCEGRVCGGDGCNGSCGSCGTAESCRGGQCGPAWGLSCDTALGVGELPWERTASTADFNDSYQNPCPGASVGTGGKDYAYRFTAALGATFTFRVSADFPTSIYALGDCADPGDSCVASGTESIDVAMSQGETVFVIVDGAAAGDEGSFTFRAEETCSPRCQDRVCGADGCGGSCGECAVPADVCLPDGQCVDPLGVVGNTCDNPFAVGELPFAGTGDTGDAFNHYAIAAGACEGYVQKGVGTAEQVWRFDPPAAGRYRVTTRAGDFDSVVYAISDCEALQSSCLGANDGQRSDQLVVDLDSTAPVFLIVDGADNVYDETGEYTIEVEALTSP